MSDSRATRVGLGVQGSARRALFNIHEELEGFSEEELQRFGEQIFMAKTAKGPDSHVIEGKIFAHRKFNKFMSEKCIADTGCSHSIISEQIVKELNLIPRPFKQNLSMVRCSGTVGGGCRLPS